MSFVYLGGDETTKPTYFEVVAAERLVPSLKAALVYALSVFSQRRPWMHRLLQYDDEVFALVTLALDGQSLAGSDSTFADSLYGMKRQAAAGAEAGSGGKPAGPGPRLSKRQRRLVLLCQVLLPYARAKIEKAYKRLSGGGVLGLALRSAQRQGGRPDEDAGPGLGPGSLQRRLTVGLQRAFVASYPWAHAAMEATTFGYHLTYLLGNSPVHSPVLHALGLGMARISASDMAAAEKAKQASRQALLTAGGAAGRLRRGLLNARFLLADHAHNALVLAVFGFKALEWWYTAGEERMAQGKALPPPPPPPPPRPSPDGVGLPTNPADCPVCRRRTTNPAAVSTSGYVFCYPCAFNYVMQHSRCPVSQLPATLDHIRRLYEAG